MRLTGTTCHKKKVSIALIILFSLFVTGYFYMTVYACETSVILGSVTKSNNTQRHKDMSITLSETYCDGDNLLVTFIIKKENLVDLLHEILLEKDINLCSFVYEGDCYMMVGSNKMVLQEEVGVPGVSGEFIDESTYVGVESLSIPNVDSANGFPDSFELHITMKSFGFMCGKEEIKIPTTQKWVYEVSVQSNKDEVIVYEISKENNGHSIDKVTVSPMMITVYTSYPDIYGDTVDYTVNIYNDSSSEDEVPRTGHFGKRKGVVKIPRKDVGKELYIYVWDYSSLGEEKNMGRSSAREHAIVFAKVSIQ